jgi:23S rRNA (cytidine2498-2'-O)-methyltransferase
MHLILSAHGDDAALLEEIGRAWPAAEPTSVSPGLIAVEEGSLNDVAASPLAFSRQLLPDAAPCRAPSVKGWAKLICDAIIATLPDDQPWRLHVVPFYGPSATPGAGERRAKLIHDAALATLKERRRRMVRQLSETRLPLTPADSLVQVLLTSPEQGFVSVAPAAQPHTLRRLTWPFPAGEVPVASDPSAPSRAFAKLLEAEARLGRRIAEGETCIDLGAAPGSWSFVALARGAHVTAVDRSPLRDDLMRHSRLRFHRGDAFRFAPEQPVDWLLCDVIAAPRRSVDLLLDWARHGRMRRFVVTIKFQGRPDLTQLQRLKAELPPFTTEWRLVRLTANKNEACAFGAAAETP